MSDAVVPDLDTWLNRPVIQIRHRRDAHVDPETLWAAAQTLRLRDTRILGRLIRARIPGLSAADRFDDLFRNPPFNVLQAEDGALVSGLVGRIWTLRRDYPVLADPDEFRQWSARGTVRVLFATWVEPVGCGVSALVNETRVDAVDRRARLGLKVLAPLILRYQDLIGREGLEIAISRAQHTPEPDPVPEPEPVPGPEPVPESEPGEA